MKKEMIRFHVYVLCVYLLLLPVDATLGNIIGSISLINYVVVLYILFGVYSLVKNGINLINFKKISIFILYFAFFITSLLWGLLVGVNSWYIFSLLSSFSVLFFAALDKYTVQEFDLMKKAVLYSGLIVILLTMISFDFNSNTRFILNIGRYMDPNYFATGFVLITAISTEKILKKEDLKVSIIVLISLLFIVILTGSRGGLLANIFVILIVYLFHKGALWKKSLAAIVITLLFLIIYNYFKQVVPIWVLERLSLDVALEDGGSGRTSIWSEHLQNFSQSSLREIFIGSGFSTFPQISFDIFGIPKVAHSIYIQSLIEGGVIGLILSLSILLNGMKHSLTSKRTFVFAALIGVMIGGLTLDIHVSRFFWVIILFSVMRVNGNGYKSRIHT